MTREIIINNKATVKANGKLNSGNCKPVVCIDTGEVYTSLTDAAEKNGVRLANMSHVICGHSKKTGGKRFCLLSELEEHFDEMSERMQTMYTERAAMEEKARLWDEYQAEQERIEKERREHEMKVIKLSDKLARRNRIIEKLQAELAQAIEYRDEAAAALAELTGEGNT